MSKLSSEDNNITNGKRLLDIRAVSQLSQQDFALKLGLSHRAYANYERGEREMPTSLFQSLVETFRIDPLWLLTGQEDEPLYLSESKSLDASLLEGIVCLVEEWLAKYQRTLRPEKKARVIRLAYDHCISLGQVDAGYVSQMLDLAA